MAGAPPFGPESLVTLENWQRAPFNRWAFQHIRELIPTARIARGEGPAWELPRSERDLAGIRFGTQAGQLTVGELLDQTYTDGFLVIHQGKIVTEQYFNGLRPGTSATACTCGGRTTASPGPPTRSSTSARS
jgi:hypothetical protein